MRRGERREVRRKDFIFGGDSDFVLFFGRRGGEVWLFFF